MGCGDHWPRCNGEWFPPLDLPTLIEISHRWVAALVSVLVFAVAAVAWRRHRSRAALRNPALARRGPAGGAGAARRRHRQAGPPAVGRDHPLRQRDGAARGAARRSRCVRRLRRRRRSPPTSGTARTAWCWRRRPSGSSSSSSAPRSPTSTRACSASASRSATAARCRPRATLAVLHWSHRVLAFGFLVCAGRARGAARLSREPRAAGAAALGRRGAGRDAAPDRGGGGDDPPSPAHRASRAAPAGRHGDLGGAGDPDVPLGADGHLIPSAREGSCPGRALARRPTWSRSPSRGSSRCCW